MERDGVRERLRERDRIMFEFRFFYIPSHYITLMPVGIFI